MKQGTEWTEPEKGATIRELLLALPLGARTGRNQSDNTRGSLVSKLDPIFGRSKATDHTNLRLTGEPLTAEDLKRIAECK